MQLNTRERQERARRFLLSLKQSPNIAPFLNLEEITRFGIYDFRYINQESVSFQIVEKNLREGKYLWLDEFLRDVQAIFVSVSDYVFHCDELQDVCSSFIQRVNEFRTQITEHYGESQAKVAAKEKIPKWIEKEENGKNPEETAITKEEKEQILAEMDMLFAFQSFQRDPIALRILANHEGMANQVTKSEFSIDVDIKSDFMKKYFGHEEP